MSKTWVLIFSLVLAPVTGALAVDCSFPKAPSKIPDGKTASEPEMMEAMSAFKQYNGEVTAYTTCLEKETADKVHEVGASPTMALQIKALQSRKHNAAVDELQEKAKVFNEQVRIFKARK